MKIVFYIFYRFFAYYLPKSSTPIIGRLCKKMRAFLVSNMFEKTGKNINVERKAKFGLGRKISIGDNSGIGINAEIPSNTIIGNNVMMGPDCIIYAANHNFNDLSIPMNIQGHSKAKRTIIGDDVWIGGRVIILPGKRIGDGVIIGAGSVVTKDLENYGIYAGNPIKLIKYRDR